MSVKVDIDGNGNIVIQKVEGSTITINPSVPEEIRKALIDHQFLISELPDKIIRMLMENNTSEPPVVGANVYLGLNLLIKDFEISGVTISVQITNLTKEIRFYNKPFFKVSIPLDKGTDTFMMTNVVDGTITFPRKMEYGEVLAENYQLVVGNIQMFQEMISNDPDATLTAFVSTTLGEVYKSEPYKISDIIKQGKYVR